MSQILANLKTFIQDEQQMEVACNEEDKTREMKGIARVETVMRLLNPDFHKSIKRQQYLFTNLRQDFIYWCPRAGRALGSH